MQDLDIEYIGGRHTTWKYPKFYDVSFKSDEQMEKPGLNNNDLGGGW